MNRIDDAKSDRRGTAGFANINVRLGDAMSLPLDNECVDLVIFNGVLNLVGQIGRVQRSLTSS